MPWSPLLIDTLHTQTCWQHRPFPGWLQEGLKSPVSARKPPRGPFSPGPTPGKYKTPTKRGQLMQGSPRPSPGQGMDASGAFPQDQVLEAYQQVSGQARLSPAVCC